MRLLVLTTIVMLAFAANSVLTRFALAEGAIGPSAFAIVRVVSGALMLAILVYWQDRRVFDLGEVSALSAGSLTLYVLGFSYAYVSLDTGVGALILFGGVQITMFAGAVLARDHVPVARWIGAAVALGGLAYLLAPGSQAPGFSGTLLMAAAAIGWGYYSLYGRGVARPLQATAGNFLLAIPVAIAVGLLFWDSAAAQPNGIVLAVISGAITSGLGYALWYKVLPQLQATVAAVAQLTVPVIAAAGGIVFLGEGLSLRFVVASVMILGGVAVAVWR